MSCLKLYAPVELRLFDPDEAPVLRLFRVDEESADRAGAGADEPRLLPFAASGSGRPTTTAPRRVTPLPPSSTSVVYVPVAGGPVRVEPEPCGPRLRLFAGDE